MRISASLVLYNNKRKDVVSVVNCATRSIINKIIVIDQSENDYYRFLQDYSDKVVYVHNKNNGYGAGHNLAVKIVCNDYRSDFHVVLNPDVIFSEDCILGLSKYMISDISIGLIMPKVYYPDGKLQYLCKLLPSPRDILSRYLFNDRAFKTMYNRFVLYSSNYDKVMNVPYLSGCFMFFRLEAFIKVGGFDERFFMHFEDLDISRRVYEEYKTLFIPNESIVHVHEAAQRKSMKMLFIALCSAIKYFNKWGWFWDSRRRMINKQTILLYATD